MNSESVPEPPGLVSRVAALERAVADLGVTLHTRRLVLADEEGHERIVMHTERGVAEVRIVVPGREPGRSCMVALFASPSEGDTSPGVGIQVWADGDTVAEL